MPRVTTSKANKDYPAEGIKRGDVYYSWAFFRQPTRRSKTYPRPSQLCNNVMSGAYGAHEELEDACGTATVPQDIVDALNTCAEGVRSVIEELEEQISNMEEAFQGGSPMIDEKTEQKDGLETFAHACEEAATEVENLDASDYRGDGKTEVTDFDGLDDDEKEEMLEAARDIANALSIDV